MRNTFSGLLNHLVTQEIIRESHYPMNETDTRDFTRINV